MNDSPAVLTVSWQAVTAIAGLLVLVIGAATAYLKLFMQTKLAELEKNITKQIKDEFQTKEKQELKNTDFESRLSKLEGKVFAI